MAVTIKQTEAAPASYPGTAPWFTVEEVPEDNPVSSAQVWQRIEAYTAYRWTPREVVWIVEGDGDWCPNLAPCTVTAEEIWDGSNWIAASVFASPYGGYRLTSEGPFRFTATVGGGDVPEAVQEAFRRLHEYTRGINDSFKNEAAYRTSGDSETVVGWTARALQLSGAADLLRPYRRA